MGVATRPAVTAFAPASIGNVAAGFDVLGLAVRPVEGKAWGDAVTVAPAEGAGGRLTVGGSFAGALPGDPADNLALRCLGIFRRAMEARGLEMPPVDLHLHKGLPLCSGLGSSSASVVATLVALNAHVGRPLGDPEVLTLAGLGEGVFSGAPHLDNVAPALLGGLQLIDPAGGSSAVPWPEAWRIALVHPDLQVPTTLARQALPGAIPLGQAVAYWQNLAALIHGLHLGDLELAERCLRDPLVEAYRAPLVPGFQAARAAALEAGAFAFSLSGSGPSVFAVCRSHAVAASAAGGITRAFEALGHRCHGGVFVARVGAILV